MERRLERIERDVDLIEATLKVHAQDISTLKEGQAETRIFQKLIMEQLGEIKILLNTKGGNDVDSTKQWFDLLKWVLGGTILAIVAYLFKGGSF